MGEGGKTTSRRGRVNVAKWGSKTTSQKVKRGGGNVGRGKRKM